jgi:hypothetical protein
MPTRTQVVALAAAVLLLSGCDLGTYEERMQKAKSNIGNKAAAAAASMGIPDKTGASTGVTFLLPTALGKGGDPLKAIAGPFKVDGLAGMYEAPSGNGGGPMLLLGGVPAAEGPLDKVVANVTAAMQAAAPGQQVQAGDVKPTVKRLLVTGPQAFNIGGADQSLPGRTEAYVVSSASHIAILVFRVTDANDPQKSFEGQINAAIGSIQGDAGGAAPAGS